MQVDAIGIQAVGGHVPAGHQTRTRWPAYWRLDVAVLEEHTLCGQGIQVRGVDEGVAVGAESVEPQIGRASCRERGESAGEAGTVRGKRGDREATRDEM